MQDSLKNFFCRFHFKEIFEPQAEGEKMNLDGNKIFLKRDFGVKRKVELSSNETVSTHFPQGHFK